ncbi:predicted protein [Plenodomus lingam JN3]|uniref:Predicted protein n=1 Tax=Leptosphaeria maculans (strain JN3 / isolate v23.1.3 / race Av1-4-5-6-7-8) TaxID=985895 RepID=E4ZM86_LEPMJ|nr:predicted protein [Plenodomus lingam JN3]CBX92435.1 predicted protein [Plenodomus lingam JN3]
MSPVEACPVLSCPVLPVARIGSSGQVGNSRSLADGIVKIDTVCRSKEKHSWGAHDLEQAEM